MTLESYNCEICSLMVEETVEHLFWRCPFAQQCWEILNLQTVHAGDFRKCVGYQGANAKSVVHGGYHSHELDNLVGQE